MYEKDSLYSKKSIRSTASNILANRIRAIRLDLIRGKDFTQASDSILIRASAAVNQKGIIDTGVFLKENANES